MLYTGKEIYVFKFLEISGQSFCALRLKNKEINISYFITSYLRLTDVHIGKKAVFKKETSRTTDTPMQVVFEPKGKYVLHSQHSHIFGCLIAVPCYIFGRFKENKMSGQTA